MFWYDQVAMLTTQERLEIFLDVLERVAPGMRERALNDLPLQTLETGYGLSELLDRLGPLPPCSALMGVCEDGLPFLLDLGDPTPGSILVVADDGSGKTALLRSILASTSVLNRSEEVAFTIVTPNPGKYENLEDLDNCRTVLSTFERDASELVVELADLAEQRKNMRNQGTVEVLAIDDLAAFVQNNDYEVNTRLRWLIAQGPQAAIWPIATVKTGQLWRIQDGIYEAFGTTFVGRTSSSQLPSGLGLTTMRQEVPGVFTVPMGDEWIRFWIPNLI